MGRRRNSLRGAGESLAPRVSLQFLLLSLCRPQLPAVNHDFCVDLDEDNIHLIPSLDDILARLAGEVRLEAQPPALTFAFTKHSTDLLVIRQEQPNTAAVNYLTARTAAEVAANDGNGGLKLPMLPPIEVLCSLNLVVAAMQQRIAQPAPAPEALSVESKRIADFAWILYNMWYIRSGDESQMEMLVHETQRLVSLCAPEHAYAPFILRPEEHEFEDLKPAPLPPDALRNGPRASADGQEFSSTLQFDTEQLGGLEGASTASEQLDGSQEHDSPALLHDEDNEDASYERVQQWLEEVSG
ncbi:hypothetical protein JCM10296v2_004825 [Rhodotorula toruloides]